MKAPVFGLDNFPDSAYAEQLRRGFGLLRFHTKELEAGFSRFHLDLVIRRVRVWQLIMAFVTVGLVTIRLVRSEWQINGDILLRATVLLPCSLALAWAACTREYHRWYPPTVGIVSPILYVTAMFLATSSASISSIAIMVVPTIVLLAASLLIGMLFWQSVALTLLILGAYIGGGFAFGGPAFNPGYQAAILTLVWVVGCVLSYGIEKSLRIAFLQNGLLTEMVTLDGLTGLKNRRAFDEHLKSSWQQALRDRRCLGVLMIDVDHFKRYNDRYGHQAGDEALRQVARVAKEMSRRPLDLAARYGGEEFGVILYDLEQSAVEDIAERIRAGVEQLAIPHADSPNGVVTASIGLAVVLPNLEHSPAGAIQLADEALYQAKADGRNKVRKAVQIDPSFRTGHFRLNRISPAA